MKTERKSGFLLKHDFTKIYDRVNWDCLMEVIRARKFLPIWTSWIELKSAKTLIM